MSHAIPLSFVFLNLEPFVREARGRLPKAYETLFASDASPEKRRGAFLRLLESIESDWIGKSPETAGMAHRRRATLALYALLDGSPMDSQSDLEIERVIRWLI